MLSYLFYTSFCNNNFYKYKSIFFVNVKLLHIQVYYACITVSKVESSKKFLYSVASSLLDHYYTSPGHPLVDTFISTSTQLLSEEFRHTAITFATISDYSHTFMPKGFLNATPQFHRGITIIMSFCNSTVLEMKGYSLMRSIAFRLLSEMLYGMHKMDEFNLQQQS